ncbi:putative 17.2kDa protein, CinA-related competence damage protein [Legionella lansingensis]|uniref:CinA-like competence damage protein n=1 Tax=Legionella lansingensis TaxID=45067 RepID=A0A0W0VS84_9GAMM|nr:CinA family protein [Legionella lansingensis]KTD22869.1 CinA-like competence damage protein [Legionella lansingensis]SNV53699.1 putative 17.2kDa protein, CinA-related competence damage protein [Legionella lansingensis]
MKKLKKVLDYLKEKDLILTTAESCTAGQIIHLLANYAGSGECLDAGYVVYSESAKKRLLGVKQKTIDTFTLTSEEVAREMVEGALHNSEANVVIATTGIAGPDSINGIPPGTICFGWGFDLGKKLVIYSETKRFKGTKTQILNLAAKYALVKIPFYHTQLREED